jgi:hypothetical protein
MSSFDLFGGGLADTEVLSDVFYPQAFVERFWRIPWEITSATASSFSLVFM